MNVRVGRVWLAVFTASAAPSGVAAQANAESLPELTVGISQNVCPVLPSEEAQEKVHRASVGLAASVFEAKIEVEAQRLIRDVPVRNVGRTPMPDEVQVVETGSTAFGRARWMERLQAGSYAVPLSLSFFGSMFEAWEYPEFWGQLAYYFFTAEFLESHDFAFLGSDRSAVVFCGRNRSGTYIDGRLLLDEAGFVTVIDWSFATPAPDESAGGRAEFSQGPAALPTIGVFWRRRPLGDYTEWFNRYRSWSIRGASEQNRWGY